MSSKILSKLMPCQNGGNCNQIFTAIMANIPMISFGMILGWISPMQARLKSSEGPLHAPLSDQDISWMASVSFATSMPFVLVAGYVADRYGRKFCILLTSFLLAVCWLIKLVGLNSWQLILARGIAGMAGAGCYVIIPIYTKEISTKQIRGALCSLVILSQNLGCLLIYVLGDMLEYNTVNSVCFAIPALHCVLFFMMPETPSLLIKKGKKQGAVSVLSWLRCTSTSDDKVLEEVHELEMEELLTQASSKASLMTIVKEKSTFKALRVSLTIMLVQECCGYLVFLMYPSLIFEKAAVSGKGLRLSPNKQVMVLGIVQLVGSVVASSVVEKTGRKVLLAVMSCITGMGMLSLGIWFHLTSMGLWLPGWLPVTVMCVCIFCVAAGFQSMPYVILSEMFSFQHRSTVTSLCIAACATADFIQVKAFDPLSDIIGIHSIFWIYGSICFVGTAYTILFVPETKGKSVVEIYDIIGVKKKSVRDVEQSKHIIK